jgi:hypothetical protein
MLLQRKQNVSNWKLRGKKQEQAAAKVAKADQQKDKSEEITANKRLRTYWENLKSNGWDNKLQELMKSGAPIPAGAYHAPYCGSVPPICIYNQRITKLRP